jgi:hypothetical protein
MVRQNGTTGNLHMAAMRGGATQAADHSAERRCRSGEANRRISFRGGKSSLVAPSGEGVRPDRVIPVTARRRRQPSIAASDLPEGIAAMNALAAPKSPQQNRLEGFALTSILQGFPIYANAALMLKLMGAHEVVGDRWGAAIFVVLASLFHGLLTPWLASKFPKAFANAHAPCFFDETLSFADKIEHWRTQPIVSVQLVASLLLLSLLAVGVASIR